MKTFVAAFTLLACVQGCGTDCSLVGCPPPVRIVLDGSSTWGEGTYVVSVRTASIDDSCEIQLSGSNAMGGESNSSPFCSKSYPFRVGTEAGQLVVTFSEPQEQIRLSVERDGDSILSETLTPDYETTRPNGAGCGECESTEIVVDVSG